MAKLSPTRLRRQDSGSRGPLVPCHCIESYIISECIFTSFICNFQRRMSWLEQR